MNALFENLNPAYLSALTYIFGVILSTISVLIVSGRNIKNERQKLSSTIDLALQRQRAEYVALISAQEGEIKRANERLVEIQRQGDVARQNKLVDYTISLEARFSAAIIGFVAEATRFEAERVQNVEKISRLRFEIWSVLTSSTGRSFSGLPAGRKEDAKIKNSLLMNIDSIYQRYLNGDFHCLGIVFKTPCCPQWREGW